MQISFPQILFQIINFSVVAGALVYLLYKPIQKILEERANRVEEGLKAAEEAVVEKDQLTSKKAQAKKDAEKQANQLIEEATVAANKQKQTILAKAKEEAEAELAKMRNDFEADKKRQIASMQQQLVDAVVQASAKVIGAKLDTAADQKLITKELDSILEKI